MENKISVSFIIPIFNTEKYLKQCLNSIISQTLSDIEIICINDGSTDNSLCILENFAKKDKRIKVINQKNKGQSAARNKGITLAKGEYIAFVDSDDWAQPDMLEKMYNRATQDDTDVTMASVTLHNEKTGEETCHDCYVSLDVFPKEFDNKV